MEKDIYKKIIKIPNFVYIGNPFLCKIHNGNNQLVFKYGGKSLSKYLKCAKKEKKDVFKLVLAGLSNIIYGIYSLNKNGIHHFDIKTRNILIIENEDNFPFIRIIDFGLVYFESDGLDDLLNSTLNQLDYFYPPESFYLSLKEKKLSHIPENFFGDREFPIELDLEEFHSVQNKLNRFSKKKQKDVILNHIDMFMFGEVILELFRYRKYHKKDEQLVEDLDSFIVKICHNNVFKRLSNREACEEYFKIVKKHTKFGKFSDSYMKLL